MATQYIYDMADAWTNSGTTYTFLKANVTDTASASGSLLMDLQVGGSSRFNVLKNGAAVFASAVSTGTGPNSVVVWSGGGFSFSPLNGLSANAATGDTILTRRAAANLRLGAADAAAPVAQTLSVQSVVAGTTNTAGANLTITGSQGTGTGAGGSIVFQVAPAGSSGTAQNALATALTIDSTQLAAFAGQVRVSNTGTSAAKCGVQIGGAGFGLFSDGTVMTAAVNGSALMQWWSGGQIDILSGASLGWGSSGVSNPDVRLYRDAANTLALRNGANAQAFNIYNTYTDASNYERGFVRFTSNDLQIGTEAAGTGSARQVVFRSANGSFTFWNNSGATIGSLGANAFIHTNVELGSSGWRGNERSVNLISAAGISWSSTSAFSGAADIGLSRSAAGVLVLTNASTGGASLEFREQTAPSAPATNNVRIYAEDNGSGKTRLMALFATGAAVQIAIEP